MTRITASLLIGLSLFGCTPAAPVPDTAASVTIPYNFPPVFRWDLVPTWIQWNGDKAKVGWPAKDGCATVPQAKTLTPGELIDRFGAETGNFFSPKGESYPGRAVPYICQRMDYRVYRVKTPVHVSACKASSWFGEPGGATQYKTAGAAADLRKTGAIEVVSESAAGSAGPAPQCGSP
jgi:hypothetical protein